MHFGLTILTYTCVNFLRKGAPGTTHEYWNNIVWEKMHGKQTGTWLGTRPPAYYDVTRAYRHIPPGHANKCSHCGSHGCYVFSLEASVFTLVVKLGIIKFWLFRLKLTLMVKVNLLRWDNPARQPHDESQQHSNMSQPSQCRGHLGYCKISNIRHTKFQNLNVSHLILQLSLPNPFKPGVKWIMKM